MYYGYARVSTKAQHDTSIEVQLDYLRKQADTLGEKFTPCSEKVSGKEFEKRSVFKHLIDTTKSGDIIGIYDDSRFGRETGSNLDYLELLTNKGVRLQDAGRFIDYNNAMDKMIFTVGSAFATYQREIQLQKSREGIARMKENGDFVMRGDLFGYNLIRMNGKNIVTIDENEAYYIRYIFNEYVKGRSATSLARELRDITFKKTGYKLNQSMVTRIVTKTIYMGYYTRDRIGKTNYIRKMTPDELKKQLIKSNLYPPIVSEELWWDCFYSYREVIRKHSNTYAYRYSGYELSGVLKCKVCGARYFHLHKSNGRGMKYTVYSVTHHTEDCTEKHTRTFRADPIEFVMKATFLMTMYSTSEVGKFFEAKKVLMEQSVSDLETQKQMVNNQIEDVNKKLNNLINLAANGVDPSILKDKINTLQEEKKTLQKSLESFQNAIDHQVGEFADIIPNISEETVKDFINGNHEVRRAYYKKLVNVIAYREKLDVKYENGKEFIIQWYTVNSARKHFPLIPFTMSFRGELQETGMIDFENKKILFNYNEEIDEFRAYANTELKKFEDKVNSDLLGMYTN